MNKKYQIIYADPPWEYKQHLNWKEKSIYPLSSYYKSLSLDELKKLPIPAAENCWLILWTTVPKIQEGLELLKAWGFDYRTSAVWDKGNGLGFFFRIYHEIILIGKKGNPPRPLFTVPSIFKESRRKHSQKPDCVRKWIEEVFPAQNKIELFAREKTPGWDAIGYDIDGQDIKQMLENYEQKISNNIC